MDNVAVYLYKRTTSDEYDSINYQDICISYLNRTRQKFKATFFVDIMESPLKVKKPEFDRMISLAKNRELNIIITYDMTMISKGIVDYLNLYNTLKEYNVELISVKDNLDNTTISGRATIGLLSAFGKYKSEEASIITKKNMELNAKHGIFSGGTPPTGYKIKTVINEVKSLKYLELIQRSKEQIYNLFKLTAAGYPLSKISKESGTPEKTIINIIKNPTYVQATIDSKEYLESIGFKTYGELNSKYGFLPYNRRCKKHNKKESNSKEKFVAVSTHEPIVPADLFIAANKKISDRKTEAKPRVSNKSFLAHQIKCKCGSGMFVHSNSSHTNNGKIYFRCSAQKKYKICDSSWLQADIAEEEVLKKIREFSLNKDMLKKYLIGKNYGPTISNTDIDKFQNELNHVLNNHHDIPMCDLQVYIKEIIEAITYNGDDSLGIKIKYLD